MMGPLVMSIEGVMGGYNGRGEVLSELAFEHFDDIHEASFKGGCKLHDDIALLDGVLHDVVMVFTHLDRDIGSEVIVFFLGLGFPTLGIRICLFCYRSMGLAAVR